jgi:beta-glucosidase
MIGDMSAIVRAPRSARFRRVLAVLAVPLVASSVAVAKASADPSQPAGVARTGPARAAALAGRMTLDEKLSFLHGGTDPHGIGESGFIPGVPRLGIPALRLADGAQGIRVNTPATALPAPVALASAFDPGLARQYGEVLGRDGRAAGVNVLLGPTVGTIREPYGGRNFESFSEDPLVSAQTVAADVRGIQSQGLIATVKHFAENNQETNRDGIDVTVGEQALHQIELPGFRAAVGAGAGAVMCAYNKVNGAPACGNSELLNGILRAQWGFAGWVMSDWDATQSTDSITKGLDQEMPDSIYFGAALKKAVLAGTIPMSAVDTSVTRILSVMDRFGLLARNPPPEPAVNPAADDRVATQVAEQGAVLLRNTGNALPLHGTSTNSIAVIGPTAQTPKISGGGSAKGNPAHAAAPIDTIRARAGAGRTVTYTPGGDLFGQPIPASAFSPALRIAADGTASLPLYTGYQGSITAPAAGDYRISVSASGNEIVELIVDHQSVFAGSAGLGDGEIPIQLTKGPHQIAILPLLGPNPSSVRLGWVTPAESASLIPAAVAAAKHAGTAIVFAYDDGSEGADRSSLSLASSQNALISQVAKANPNTIVVLNSGSAITMPWLGQVRSVLDMWYPGQDGAAATTALLFGDAAPGGRLTQTFPASQNQTPVAGDPRRFPGVGMKIYYSEGIDVGYRWYNANHVTPLFPFGFGLTYTSFAYRDLSVRRDRHGGGGLDVSFTVRNTGSRTAPAVPQVYLGASPNVTEPQAVRSLAGYGKTTLRPGETRRVAIHVDVTQLKYWNTRSHRWAVGSGDRRVFVGSSSADLQLQTVVDVH